MTLTIFGHDYAYELECLTRLFFPGEPCALQKAATLEEALAAELSACIERSENDAPMLKARWRSQSLFRRASGEEAELERELALTLYDLLERELGVSPPWGILTGIRPIKLFHAPLAAGLEGEALAGHMAERYRVSPEKTALGALTAKAEAGVLARCDRQGVSLYIGIPFCPGRCSYCSFVSHSIEKAGKLLPAYLDTLCEELSLLGEITARLGKRVQTLYIGGGTPTVLSAAQLERLLSTIERSFALSGLEEFTVEAGRPDTIDRPKLETLAAHGVDRLSVNPQTMNDEVLRGVGRRHSAEQIVEAFALARLVGFRSINMDLIAGLPGDTPAFFAETLRRVAELSPENVTVHTLALKRAADLMPRQRELHAAEAAAAAEMVSMAAERLCGDGYRPYYLYRQKNTLGNLENTGYAKPGTEGLYNVFIMDETHSILSAGAGAVTKLRDPQGGRIERIFSYKYPYEYIDRFAVVRERRQGIEEFYRRMEAEHQTAKNK